jgi:tRNA(fMet)-specific endonuclease VapC
MTTEGYLLDTTVASQAVDGQSPYCAAVRGYLAGLADAMLYVSMFTVGEIEYGLGVSPAIDPARHAAARAALAEYEVLPVDHHTAREFGRIRAELFKRFSPRDRRGRLTAKVPEDLREPTTAKELGIQENDLWIASVAVQYDLRFLTMDRAGGMRRVLEAAGYLDRTDFFVRPETAPTPVETP